MKIKNLFLIGLIVGALTISIIPINASAAPIDVKRCSITLLGWKYTDGGTAMIQLKDEGTSPLWTGAYSFSLHPSLGKAGYATLLTAYSLSKTIRIKAVGLTPGAYITHIYLNP
jgi:hypothetical protein